MMAHPPRSSKLPCILDSAGERATATMACFHVFGSKRGELAGIFLSYAGQRL